MAATSTRTTGRVSAATAARANWLDHWRSASSVAPAAWATVAVLLLWAPYVPNLLTQTHEVTSDFWIPRPNLWRVANELRSEGAAEAEKIRADADRQREIIVAEAYRDAQKVKGEGDAKAAALYAEAFSKSPEFYAFYRSLEAYRNSFASKNDVLVVEPNSEFFKYLKNQGK
mgnify:CR=1 FL=1